MIQGSPVGAGSRKRGGKRTTTPLGRARCAQDGCAGLGWAGLPSWDGAADPRGGWIGFGGPREAGMEFEAQGEAGAELLAQGMELLAPGRLPGGHDLLLEHSRPTELSSCMNWLWPQAKAIPPPLPRARCSQPRLRASRPLSALLFMCLSPKKGLGRCQTPANPSEQSPSSGRSPVPEPAPCPASAAQTSSSALPASSGMRNGSALLSASIRIPLGKSSCSPAPCC